MGINFWPLLGLWAGLTEIVPILGPWLGGIPAFIIALTQSWQQAVLVACFVVVLQMTENAVLVPRVMNGAVGLTPLTVFIAILAGTEFAGIAGALAGHPRLRGDPGLDLRPHRRPPRGDTGRSSDAARLAVDARLDGPTGFCARCV